MNIAEPIRAIRLARLSARRSSAGPDENRLRPPLMVSCHSPISATTQRISRDALSRQRASLKGKPLDVKTIGRELNVRYVLEGSVQRSGNRMRVNVDTAHRRYCRLSTWQRACDAHFPPRRGATTDLYFQGLAWINRGATPDNVVQARRFFDRALTADPDNVDALVASARAEVIEGVSAFVADPIAAFAGAETKLTRALSLVPDHARGHAVLGHVEIVTIRFAECEHL